MLHVPLLQHEENDTPDSEVLFTQPLFIFSLSLLVLNLHWQYEAFSIYS